MPNRKRQPYVDKRYLREFLNREMAKRPDDKGKPMSRRNFAEIVGVSNDTINQVFNSETILPSLEFVLKLSEATNTPADAMLSIAYPNYAHHFKIEPFVVLLVKEFEGLSEAEQSFMLNAVRGLKRGSVSNKDDKSLKLIRGE